MYTFEHEQTEQTPALIDYRYIGNSPNNYVRFNGNETWRIIGVFYVDTEDSKEQKIKIVKDVKLSNNMDWNSTNNNDWKNATLNKYLNGNYYDSLNYTAKQLISSSKFFLGEGDIRGNAEEYYLFERGINVHSGRSTNWSGMIALMYPSDYVYTYALGVDETCYSNGANCANGSPISGWIYNSNSNSDIHLLSANSSNDQVYDIGAAGFIGKNNNASVSRGVRPTLYLKSNVKIKSGDGSIDSPYEFEL